jgi:hypothetical protein
MWSKIDSIRSDGTKKSRIARRGREDGECKKMHLASKSHRKWQTNGGSAEGRETTTRRSRCLFLLCVSVSEERIVSDKQAKRRRVQERRAEKKTSAGSEQRPETETSLSLRDGSFGSAGARPGRPEVHFKALSEQDRESAEQLRVLFAVVYESARQSERMVMGLNKQNKFIMKLNEKPMHLKSNQIFKRQNSNEVERTAKQIDLIRRREKWEQICGSLMILT